VTLADNGSASMPITVPPGASETTRTHADTLETQLERITGADFAVVEGDGTRGIYVSTADDASHLDVPNLTPTSPFDRGDFLVRTHDDGVYLVGATELAVRQADWNLLRRAGYRQYFPGDNWDIVPDRPTLELAADEHESPAFLFRNLVVAYGSWSDNERRLRQWRRKNNADGAFRLRNGHAWQRIILANEKTFEEHPEYLGEYDNGEPSRKLCVTDPEVQQMAIEWAIRWLETHPSYDSVPMDPSDGGGWEGCPQDQQQLGSPSNRAVFLANKVAEGIDAHFDEPKYVGMYAYNEHQSAPTISIHERVIPSVATAFLDPDNTPEQLLEDWEEAGAEHLGVREYYNVAGWSDDLPGMQQASSPSYLEESLRRYRESGARFLEAGTSDAWGPTGLGHWMSMRLAWQIDDHPDARLRDQLRDDFMFRAFRRAHEPVDTFYAILDRGHPLLPSEHRVARMYRLLDRALAAAEDPDVKARIRELVLYTRYVDLFRDYKYADSDRQAKFEQLIRFAYRIHDTHMVHSMAHYRILDRRDAAVSIPEGADWWVDESDNPWKSSEPYTPDEIEAFLEQGIAEHQLRDFQPVSFSRDLVSAAPLDLDMSKTGQILATADLHEDLEGKALDDLFDGFYRARSLRENGIVTLYTRVPRQGRKPVDIEFSISAENIHGARTGGELPVELFSLGRGRGRGPDRVDATTIPVDASAHRDSFSVNRPGLYRLDIQGLGRFFDVGMHNDSPELRQTYELSTEQWVQPRSLASYVFYVPEGTETIGGYATPGAEFGDLIERPDGSVALKFGDLSRSGYFSVEVGEGEDGKLWRLDDLPSFKRLLMTVPPQVADSPDELLLPREVVEADR
jgi:hypothetical protein